MAFIIIDDFGKMILLIVDAGKICVGYLPGDLTLCLVLVMDKICVDKPIWIKQF